LGDTTRHHAFEAPAFLVEGGPGSELEPAGQWSLDASVDERQSRDTYYPN
jgi:hypothetical protein